ncbi:3'-5' exoribonuclease YhaM [Thalassobacillus devorans]|uniref:3'-5' exoribonuclease YhaM n=1 Tax=Thalassobacillus devorans TaxID=279813 RepID=UPI00048BD94F|nr:3'-5' exoribonuclease YhaM [Thalassobacillus devorans]
MKKGIAYYSVGDGFDSFMMIKSASKGVASNGKPFLTLMLKDATGEIESKLWEATPEDEALFQAEELVKLSGEVTSFRGRQQLKIQSIRPIQATDGVKPEDFVEKAPVKKEELMERITEAIFEMKNPNIQRLVRYFVQKYQEALLTYPAATKNHHAYVSGLAHHIVSMLNLARQLKELYPSLNKDLLYAGVILHDLGKLKELSGAAAPNYTIEGKLIGHIPMMVQEIGQAAEELKINGEEVTVVQHLVLSHHGKSEWGSPKPPLVREAEVLHLIDLMDAKMNMLDRALDKVEPGEFTERLFSMEQRNFYKPLFEDN